MQFNIAVTINSFSLLPVCIVDTKSLLFTHTEVNEFTFGILVGFAVVIRLSVTGFTVGL